MTEALQRLTAALPGYGRMAIAVSGGVDSTTLALVASRAGCEFEVFHAVSPAVPSLATARVRTYALANGWDLREIDAGEFADQDYLANPYDRCFHCKRNLYAEIARITRSQIVSGTNLDDLSDYRPGLRAARAQNVRHPLADAGVTKAMVREIADELGETSLSALPASPCLSSRVETGIAISPLVLERIDRIERRISDAHAPRAVRCRVRRDRITVEIDGDCLRGLSAGDRESIGRFIHAQFAGDSRAIGFEEYRMGSAFIAPEGH